MRISDWSSDVCSSDLVEAQRPYRRFPAHADAHAGMPVRFGAVEGAAAVDEHRAAPALREVALEPDAGGDHVLGADREVADARADLAPLVAADAAVAAGVEAQGWRHRGQRVGEGVADLAAHDQPVAFAQALEPAGARVPLGEARVRARAFDAPPPAPKPEDHRD